MPGLPRRRLPVPGQSIVRRIPIAIAPPLGGLVIGAYGVTFGVRLGLAITVTLAALTLVAVIAFVIGGLREVGEPARKAMIVDLVQPVLRARSVGLYVYDVTNAANPVQVRVLGLPAWRPGGTSGLDVLNSNGPNGNAKGTGVAVKGNVLAAVDWAFGRLYVWDVTTASSPVFRGTHFAPYLINVEIDASATSSTC